MLDTLRRLRRHGTWTEIVNLVIPTLNDSEAETRALARFVRDELGPDVPVHFTRFHPSYRLQNLPSTPVATLERCRAVAMAEGLRFVYLGNVPGHPGENTYCPGCGKLAHPPPGHGRHREPDEGRRLPATATGRSRASGASSRIRGSSPTTTTVCVLERKCFRPAAWTPSAVTAFTFGTNSASASGGRPLTQLRARVPATAPWIWLRRR